LSDYIVITDYAAKDALLTGNPAKLVKGTEIKADFDAVAVAVATKHDSTDLGVSVQAYDAFLTSIATLGTAADKMIYTTAANTAAESAITTAGRALIDDATASDQLTTLGVSAFAKTILDDADEATFKATVNLEIGTDVEAYAASRIQTCWIPAGAMISRTTNGAAAGTVETTTNKNMIKTLDFDATTAEYAQFSINMPKGWDEGTVTAAFVWSHAATTTNFGVAWELAGVAVSDDDAMDVAFGTAGTVTDTGGTTNDCYITAASSAITIAGTPATNDLVMFQVNRTPANGSDTMAIDARLHGVRLMYAINTLTDA
jgi:hypothetical protein